nr:4Fe-4S dicluster domain-containing protein [Candidatus Sigynarchaeota archaeon]
MTADKTRKEEGATSLLNAINQHPLAGNDYLACIQCGRCVGSCPAAKVSEKFNMRVINQRIIENDTTLLADETIWDCFYCQSCVNLCPRDNIDSYKTILILRDLALDQGHGLQHMKNILPIMRWYIEKGVLTDGPSWMEPRALDEVRKINEITGLNERVHGLEQKLRKASAAKE